jgi:hypothetical protein
MVMKNRTCSRDHQFSGPFRPDFAHSAGWPFRSRQFARTGVPATLGRSPERRPPLGSRFERGLQATQAVG